MGIKIYGRDGSLRGTVAPDDNSTQQHGVQADNVLSLTFTHYGFLGFETGDYADFFGSRYWLMDVPAPEQVSDGEWKYSLRLYGIESLIKRFLVLETTDGDTEPVFTLTAPAREHVAMVVGCINAAMGGSDWKVGRVDGTGLITIDYRGMMCDAALAEIARKVGERAEWWAEGQTVNICRCEHGEAVRLGYRAGLKGIAPVKGDTSGFFTRLFPVGSTRNIDPSRYGHSRLMLPGGEKYVDTGTAVYGVYDHFEEDAFSGIYPRRTGCVSYVRSEERKDDSGNPYTVYYFKDEGMGFDPNAYELPGETKRVSFQDGDLEGLGTGDDHYFEVDYNSKTGEFEIKNLWNGEQQQPGDGLVPHVGDHYILWNIRMPDEYYPMAEAELAEAVEQYIEDSWADVTVYKGTTDHVWLEEAGIDLAVGRRVRLESSRYFPGQGFRDSRITRMTRKVNNPYWIDLEISDAVQHGTLQRINDRITELDSYVRSGASGPTLPDIIRTGDNTRPTDNNLFSALRVLRDFISKAKDDRTPYKVSSDKGFEAGNYLPGVSGGFLGMDAEGDSFAEVARLWVRVRAYFEELTVIKAGVLAGKQYITPGGGIKCTRVEETPTAWRCWFLSEQDGEKTETKIVAGDQAIAQVFNAKEGTANKVSNHRYWRLVTAVDNDALTDDAGNHYGYIELSKTDCEAGSDTPKAGDEICQFGSRDDRDRQSAMVFSTVDADAPSVKLYSGIDSFSLAGKAVVSFGRDPQTGQVYFRLGASGARQYLEYTQDGGLVVAGSISTKSTLSDGRELGAAIDGSVKDLDVLYISHTSQTQAPALPVLGADGSITDYRGWRTEAPAYERGRFVWQTTYTLRGDGTAGFAGTSPLPGQDIVTQTGEVVEYAAGTSGTTPPATGWQPKIPAVTKGQFLWTRVTTSYSDGPSTVSYSVSYIPRDGADGSDGKDGAGYTPNLLRGSDVQKASTKYEIGHYEWDARPPLGTVCTLTVCARVGAKDKEIAIFQDNGYVRAGTFTSGTEAVRSFTFAVTDSTASGADHDRGISFFHSPNDGDYDPDTYVKWATVTPGNTPQTAWIPAASEQRGVTIASESVKYAKDTAGVQPADTAFTADSIGALGTIKGGDYIWSRKAVTYTDGTVTKEYAVSRIGADGETSVAGLHVAYASGITGSLPHPTAVTGFSTTMFDGARYIGICKDDKEEDPGASEFGKYDWARFVGEDAAPAKLVVVNADAQAFTYKDDFATLTGADKIHIKASVQGIDNPTYQWGYKFPNGPWTAYGANTGDTLQLSASWGNWGDNRSVTWRCTVGGVYDEVTVMKVSSGAKGDRGENYTGNLLLKSGEPVTSATYPTKTYRLAEAPAHGEECTITIWGELSPSGPAGYMFAAYNSGGIVSLCRLSEVADGVYSAKFRWINYYSSPDEAGAVKNPTSVHIYAMPNGHLANTIRRIKLERGHNSSPVWTPNAEDLETVSVTLTNEAHIFEGDTEKAVAGYTECGIVAYKGAEPVKASLPTSLPGLPTGMTYTRVANDSTAAKFRIDVTTAFTKRQGTLTIPVTVDGRVYDKVFSWSLSLQGKARSIAVKSYGYSNQNTGGDGYVRVDGRKVDTSRGRGINMVTLDRQTLAVVEQARFDLYTGNPGVASERTRLIDKINSLDDGVFVCLYFLDNATWTAELAAAMRKLGSLGDIRTDGSSRTFAFIGYKGLTPGYALQAQTANATPPNAEVSAYVADGMFTTSKTAVGIDRIVEEYYLSTSRETPAGGSWTTKANRPAWKEGHYWWTRSHIYYTDGTEGYTDGVCAMGEAGAPAFRLDLSEENVPVSCHADGTVAVSGNIATSKATVYKGGAADTGWAFSKADSGCTSSINSSTGVITVNTITADRATVTVTARKAGHADLTAVMNLWKVRPGAGYTPNLLSNSAFSNGLSKWDSWGAPATREVLTQDGKKWLHLKTTTAAFQGVSQRLTAGVRPGRYTFSALVRGAATGQAFSAGVHFINQAGAIASQDWYDWTVGTEARRVSWTVTVPSGTASLNLMAGRRSSGVVTEVFLTDLKLEEGTNPTPVWTPNAEDLEAKSVTVNVDAQIISYADNYNTLVGPATVNLSATLQGTTGYQWSYKQEKQTAFTDIPGATSPTYALARDASIWGTAKSITIRCTSGGMHDEVTIAKVSSGAKGAAGKDYWVSDVWLDATGYDADKWIPFTGTVLPSVGVARICVDVQLNSGTRPSWSTHNGGFSVTLDFEMQKSGWGTTPGRAVIYADNCLWVQSGQASPASFAQMSYSSTPVLYLRGGGKYRVRCTYACQWTARPNGYTWTGNGHSQTVSPQTSRPKPQGDTFDAYTVLLTNESHTFAGGVSSAVAGDTTCEVIAYKGATRVPATINSITGQVTGLTTAITNPSTTSASSGFAVNVTTALTQKQGVLKVNLTVDGKTFTREFSWSLALKGATGDRGPAATVYRLGLSANAIVRNLTGGLSPSAVTVTKYKVTGDSRATTTEKCVHYQALDGTGKVQASGTLATPGSSSFTVTAAQLAGIIRQDTVSVVLTLRDTASASSAFHDSESVPVLNEGSATVEGRGNMVLNSGFRGKAHWDMASTARIDQGNGPHGQNSVYVESLGATDLTYRGLYNNYGTSKGEINPGFVIGGHKVVTVSIYTRLDEQSWADAFGSDNAAMDVMAVDANGISCANSVSIPILPKNSDGSFKIGEWVRFDITVPTSRFTRYNGPTNPSGEPYAIRFYPYILKNGKIRFAAPQVEWGNTLTGWEPSPRDNDYLSQALRDALTEGNLGQFGLILATLLRMGSTGADGTYRVMSGISGLADREDAPAIWGGGDMYDAAKPDTVPSGAEAAAFMMRHNGEAYFCRNLVRLLGDHMEMGEGVRLDPDGLKLLDDKDATRMLISRKALPARQVENITGAVTNPSYTFGAGTVRIGRRPRVTMPNGLISQGAEGIISAVPFGEVSLGSLPAGSSVSGKAAVRLGYSVGASAEHPFSGTFTAEVYHVSGTARRLVHTAYGGFQDAPSEGRGSATVNFMTPLAGEYRMSVKVNATPNLGATAVVATKSVTPTASLKVVRGVDEQFVIAPDGILGAWQGMRVLATGGYFGVLVGSTFGIRIRQADLSLTDDGGSTWHALDFAKAVQLGLLK